MERPKWNTAPIRCGRTKCKWRGYEGQLSKRREGDFTRLVCPECGCDSYSFMTPGEIDARLAALPSENKTSPASGRPDQL